MSIFAEEKQISTTFEDQLKHNYDRLLSEDLDFFIVHADKTIYYNFQKCSNSIAIIPGSFNPLHKAHKNMFRKSLRNEYSFFEISIKSRGKNIIEFDDLKKRLEQFEYYASVIVSKSEYFFDKIAMIRKTHVITNGSPMFYIGIDTLERMLKDHGANCITSLWANFEVFYPRIINGKMLSISSLEEEYKFIKDRAKNISFVYVRDEELQNTSSTQIRNINKVE